MAAALPFWAAVAGVPPGESGASLRSQIQSKDRFCGHSKSVHPHDQIDMLGLALSYSNHHLIGDLGLATHELYQSTVHTCCILSQDSKG